MKNDDKKKVKVGEWIEKNIDLIGGVAVVCVSLACAALSGYLIGEHTQAKAWQQFWIIYVSKKSKGS